LGYKTVPAVPGDSVVLFAVGLGATNPAVPAGQAFSGAAAASNPATLLINNMSVTPTYVGLSSAGLFQINFTVPNGLGSGDGSIVVMSGGASTQSGIVFSLP